MFKAPDRIHLYPASRLLWLLSLIAVVLASAPALAGGPIPHELAGLWDPGKWGKWVGDYKPYAIILGIMMGMFGLKMYYVLIGLAGAALGALLGYSAGEALGGFGVVGALVGALAIGIVSVLLHRVFVFLLAALIGYSLGMYITKDPTASIVIAVLMGAAGLVGYQLGILLFTAIAGAFLLSLAAYGELYWWVMVFGTFVGGLIQVFTYTNPVSKSSRTALMLKGFREKLAFWRRFQRGRKRASTPSQHPRHPEDHHS